MGPILISLATLGVLSLLGMGAVALAFSRLQRLPENAPHAFLSRAQGSHRPVLVCVGDSITHGRASANYVDLVHASVGATFDVVNAGINGQLAWNLLGRLDAIIACRPALVTVLIGTNDAAAALSEQAGRRYMRDMKLPRLPDREGYRDALHAVVQRLKTETTASVALVTLPIMGVRRDEPAWSQAASYSELVRELARTEGVAVLDLHAAMVARLGAFDGAASPPFSSMLSVMFRAILRRTLLGSEFTRIGHANGFRLLADHLHLDEEGAALVCGLIVPWVERAGRELLPPTG